MISEGRLLCHVIQEQSDIARWENEGGAISHPAPVSHCARVQRRIMRRLQNYPATIDGLNFAIELCEAVARDILADMTARGRPTRGGQSLAAVAIRCSKAIGLVRDGM